MASTYALPASAMTHSHSHHGHLHSHSHSPNRPPANTPKSMRQERSNGTLHAYSASESHLGHISEHAPSHSHAHGPGRERSPSPLSYSQSAYFGAVDKPPSPYDDPFGMSNDLPIQQLPLPSYQPPTDNVDIHIGHVHAISPLESRSRFTTFVLPFVLRWPLIHTVMADKDSRRIFYFMRYFYRRIWRENTNAPQSKFRIYACSSSIWFFDRFSWTAQR